MRAFRCPRIVFGWGSMEHLRKLGFERITIVTGKESMRRHGFLDRAIDYLDGKVHVIDGVEENPSVSTVKSGARMMREFSPDAIIGLGGGSAIDAAKAMRILYEHPDVNLTDLMVGRDEVPELSTYFAAIPSTSGTATEVSAGSVITDERTKMKYPIVSDHLIPDLAILDPELPSVMPQKITAHTGMDALTHAIESYVSKWANDFSRPLALHAIKLIFRNLPKAFSDGNDRDAREKMHYASSLAGIAFTNSGLGISHSLAHKVGALFNIPHGCANAIFLPHVIEYNSDVAFEGYCEICRVIGVEEDPRALADEIRNLNKLLGIPSALRELGVPQEEFKINLDAISREAYNDRNTRSNPKECGAGDLRRIYELSF